MDGEAATYSSQTDAGRVIPHDGDHAEHLAVETSMYATTPAIPAHVVLWLPLAVTTASVRYRD